MEEITAEYAAAELSTDVELRVRPVVTVACKTDLGRTRENNEDKFEYFIAEDERLLANKGHVFVVCDGMGGHAAGQIASELASKTFIEVYQNHPAAETESALRSSVIAANRFVNDVQRAIPARKGMGTTLSALVLLQGEGHIAHVGDSRVYRLRNTVLEQLTKDHTWVEEAIQSGEITPEQAHTHPYRHVLNRAIGTEQSVEVDVMSFDLQKNDVFLLCSDGLMNHVGDAEIQEILASNTPSAAAWKLVTQALLGGGSDNCTVLIVRLDELRDVI